MKNEKPYTPRHARPALTKAQQRRLAATKVQAQLGIEPDARQRNGAFVDMIHEVAFQLAVKDATPSTFPAVDADSQEAIAA